MILNGFAAKAWFAIICVNSVFAFIKGFDPCEQVTSQFVEIVFACQNRNLTARRTFSRDVYSRHWHPSPHNACGHTGRGVRREVGRLSFMLGVPPVLRAFGAATHHCVYEFGKGNGEWSTTKMSRKKRDAERVTLAKDIRPLQLSKEKCRKNPARN